MRKLVLIVAALFAASGCTAGRDKSAAEAAVTQFHQMVDAQQYREIYQASSSELKNITSEAAFTSILETVHDRLGPVRNARQSGFHVNYSNGTGHVELNYATEFTRGSGTERFIYRVDNGAATLAGYHVNAPALTGGGPSDTGGK